MSVRLGHLTFNGDATGIVGDQFFSPRLLAADIEVYRWVATDAVYDPDTNTTRVEFDGESLG